jgi:hypothetical protein
VGRKSDGGFHCLGRREAALRRIQCGQRTLAQGGEALVPIVDHPINFTNDKQRRRLAAKGGTSECGSVRATACSPQAAPAPRPSVT